LAWPRRINSGVQALDLFAVARLDFEPPDLQRFPCLRLAQEAFARGGTASAVLNAANEVAVDAFLNRRLPFTGIARVIDEVLGRVTPHDAETLDVILADDGAARVEAQRIITGAVTQVG
jgi:1-deoxy-D-xylulose-5-phosphate reductoisomerase